MIADSVEFLAGHGRRVLVDMEHFFDGYKRNPEFALRALEAAIVKGATHVVLCDTNGGSLPHEIEDTVGAMADLVREGKMFFWPGERSCLVTEFVQYPRQRLLHVFLAAGDMDEIKRMEPSLRTFAESVKCSAICLTGRRGWVRALADLGFEEGHTIVVKYL